MVVYLELADLLAIASEALELEEVVEQLFPDCTDEN